MLLVANRSRFFFGSRRLTTDFGFCRLMEKVSWLGEDDGGQLFLRLGVFSGC